MAEIAQRRDQLQARRAELAAHLSGIREALEAPVPKDFAERASEREDDEMLEHLGAAEAREIRMIDAALARIADGDYGYCVRCGERIAEERLDMLPATPFCRKCAV
jgi:RNA polymerase-binding transcription factor DksA